jgi:hypothetical protein
MNDIRIGTIFVNVLVLPAVEADLARQIQAVIAMVALRKQGRGKPAGAAIEEVTKTVCPSFSDQHSTSRAAAPADIIEQVNVVLSPTPIEVGVADSDSPGQFVTFISGNICIMTAAD